jgi:hypothetical protein
MTKRVKVFDIRTAESFICESCTEAHHRTGRAIASIHKVIKGATKKSGNYFFTLDLNLQEIPVVLAKNFRPPTLATDRQKELRVSKASKEDIKRELQSYPKLKTEGLKHLVQKVTVEDGKNILHLKPTLDQWSHLE